MTLFGHGGELAIAAYAINNNIQHSHTRDGERLRAHVLDGLFENDRVLDTLTEMMSLVEQLGVSSFFFFYGRVKKRLMINCHLSELLTISES